MSGPAPDNSRRKAKAKPAWLRQPLAGGPDLTRTEAVISGLGLNTICHEAACPNRGQCYGQGTATFLLGGRVCTRGCTFCNVTAGRPLPPDPQEPVKIALAAEAMDLDYIVLTSPTRDDLPDGLAAHFAATILALKWSLPQIKVEVLIPDLQGDRLALETVLEADPDVIGHNLETVPRLYPKVRPQADYRRSLDLLGAVKRRRSDRLTKSGLMLGLGETQGEVETVLTDMSTAAVDIVTLGQYLAPSPKHFPVVEHVPPDRFLQLDNLAKSKGFTCQSGPLVRSSFLAHETYLNASKSI
jgi:lipoic acid synthetase